MTSHPSIAGIPLVLGGNVFGWTADEDASFAVLDRFYEAGGRMVDTAQGYSVWAPGSPLTCSPRMARDGWHSIFRRSRWVMVR